MKIPNFLIFPGSELKLLKGLELGNSGIISAICNVTASLSRKVFDDYNNKKKQTFNKKLCDIRKVFDNYNLISALHSYKAEEDSVYRNIIPPLQLLSDENKLKLFAELKKINFQKAA